MPHAKSDRSAILPLLLLGSLALGAWGCGKKGPPRPPIKIRPETVSDLELRQEGRAVLIRFTPPTSSTVGQPLGDLKEIDVMRLRTDEPVSAPATTSSDGTTTAVPRGRFISAQDFLKKADVFRTMGRVDLAKSVVDGKVQIVDDLATEPFGGPAPARFYYAVVARDGDDRESNLSNVMSLVPLEPPQPPEELAITVERGAIKLDWSAPSSGPTPVGYNVYRTAPGTAPVAVNGSPVVDTELEDHAAPPDGELVYEIRSTVTKDRPYVESATAARASVSVTDTAAPSVPTKLRVATTQGRIEVYWERVAASDLKGYIVYRATSELGPFDRLTARAVPETVFVDGSADAGRTYYYAVASIDASGNESERSQPVRGQR